VFGKNDRKQVALVGWGDRIEDERSRGIVRVVNMRRWKKEASVGPAASPASL